MKQEEQGGECLLVACGAGKCKGRTSHPCTTTPYTPPRPHLLPVGAQSQPLSVVHVSGTLGGSTSSGGSRRRRRSRRLQSWLSRRALSRLARRRSGARRGGLLLAAAALALP